MPHYTREALVRNLRKAMTMQVPRSAIPIKPAPAIDTLQVQLANMHMKGAKRQPQRGRQNT
eukprot:6477536-Amphidinium_carterae.1